MDQAAEPKKGMKRCILVRRSTDDPEDLCFYQAYGPEGTSVQELVRVCQDRWAVEECFAEAKGEVGLDHYEVRRWDSWYRHVTLCLLAHAFLVVVRLGASEEEAGRGAKRGSWPQADPDEHAGGEEADPRHGRTEKTKTLPLLKWSLWRRTHQAVAARCRKATLAAKRAARATAAGREVPPEAVTIAPEETCLTHEQWASVSPLLPAYRGEVGRPPHDHREVLGGILWVERTGSSWREMPEEFGKWERAYRRYESWLKQGLWQRILDALGERAPPGPVTKEE